MSTPNQIERQIAKERMILTQAKRNILRLVLEKQALRQAKQLRYHKPVRVLVLNALFHGEKPRNELYQYVLKSLKGKVVQKKLENNVNINLHTLAKKRLIKKMKVHGGCFHLTPSGKKVASA